MMMRRYVWLFLAAVGAAVIAGMAVRGPRAIAPAVPHEDAVTQAVTVEILQREVVLSTTSIPAGMTVALRVVNSSKATARVSLAGYQDRVDSGPIVPGGVFRVEFLADRPGERFAWLVDDEPRGRLDITGPHLTGDHR